MSEKNKYFNQIYCGDNESLFDVIISINLFEVLSSFGLRLSLLDVIVISCLVFVNVLFWHYGRTDSSKELFVSIW